MNIAVDTDGCLTDLEKWFKTDGNTFQSLKGYPIKLAFFLYAVFSKPRTDAVETLQSLSENHKLINITARKYVTAKNAIGFLSRFLLRFWYIRNHIKFDKIVFCEDSQKVAKCFENDIDIIIEDNPENIKRLENTGIKVIPFRTTYSNKGVDTWQDIRVQLLSKS